jgi:hypothetical protein
MSTHPARLFASILLLGGGFIVGVTAFAVAVAEVLVDAGAPVRQPDVALLGDLIPVLPFILAFALASLVAAVGLAVEADWGDALAVGTSIVAMVTGAFGLLLIVAGSDPFASAVSAHPSVDGIGLAGAFTVAYVAVLVAVAEARQPRRTTSGALA